MRKDLAVKLKNRKIKFLIIYYVVFIIVLAASSTLARYTNNVSVVNKVDVAKFNFKISDVLQEQIIPLSDTVVDDGYGGQLVIPGSKGIITLNLDFSEVEINTKYQILVNTDTSILPQNLKFYVDPDCQKSLSDFEGKVDLQEESIAQKIYWSWEFSDEDESEYMNTELQLELQVYVSQNTESGEVVEQT